MDAELKAKWVKALRSGEYQQGKYTLRATHDGGVQRYCCLGVLAEVGGLLPNEPKADANVIPGDRRDGHDPLYPSLAAFGVLAEAQEELSGMNDHGRPFADIADYIDANL